MEDSSIISPMLRVRLLEFLVRSAKELCTSPVVKYTALCLYTERFLQILPRKTNLLLDYGKGNWLLQTQSESNLQLFALVSIWVSSKLHDTWPLSVKSLKSLGDEMITDQHFTLGDFVEAEMVFFKVLDFDIGASSIVFIYLEELIIQFRISLIKMSLKMFHISCYTTKNVLYTAREVAKIGDQVSFDVCMDIMDLIYETEKMTLLHSSPYSLAASILAVAYVISVPQQPCEFPILPWVKLITGEEDIDDQVRKILNHLFALQEARDESYSNMLNGAFVPKDLFDF